MYTTVVHCIVLERSMRVKLENIQAAAPSTYIAQSTLLKKNLLDLTPLL